MPSLRMDVFPTVMRFGSVMGHPLKIAEFSILAPPKRRQGRRQNRTTDDFRILMARYISANENQAIPKATTDLKIIATNDDRVVGCKLHVNAPTSDEDTHI